MKFATTLGVASLFALTGCGSGGGFVLVHPMGNYSNASLKGAYVYEIHGTSLVTGFPYREAGVFTADGNGHITAGVDDFEGGAASGSSTSLSGSFSGSYSVSNDGRGSIFFGPTILGNISGSGSSQVGFAVSLVSSSKVELMEGDSFAVGAGVAELQDSSAIAAAPSGTFVFRVHQEITASSGTPPAAQVGGMTVASGSGTGAMDQNLGGAFGLQDVAWGFGAPDQFGTGTATLTDSSNNATPFIYYIVNSGKFYLLTSNASVVGGGSAEAQSGTVSGGLSGSYAFGSRGDDTNYTSRLYGTVGTVGAFTATGGSITGAEDANQDGTITSNAAFPGSCAATGSAGGISGRVVVTNGSGTPCSGSITEVFWLVSPSRAFFLDNNAGIYEDGTADLQTTSSFSNSTMKGQYALVMDGWDLSGVSGLGPQLLARVGALQYDGSNKLTLSEFANGSASGGGASDPGALGGPYSVSPSGRVTGTVSNGGTPPLDFVMYAVSGSQAYVLQNDSGFVTSGMVELQQ
jgi:hypothetical protein